MLSIGVDVGGTWLRVAAVTETGEIVARRRMPLDGVAGTDAFVDRLLDGVHQVVEQGRQSSRPSASCSGGAADKAGADAGKFPIGIAVPGIIDAGRGVIIRSVNLSFLEGVLFREVVEARLGLPVGLTTDAQACTWAEFGAHRPSVSRFVHLRLGTGVGCAVARDGGVELLEREGLHHAGLLVVEGGREALACPCGLRGCLETVASGRVLRDRQNNLDRAARGTVRAMLNLAARYGPEAICIGGGLLDHCPDLRVGIENLYAEARVLEPTLPPLTRARLGDDAGTIGAAQLAGAWAIRQAAEPPARQ